MTDYNVEPERVKSSEDATPEVIRMCLLVKKKVEGLVDRTFETFVAIRYTHEAFEDGERYYVQVDVGDGDVVHICLIKYDDPEKDINVVAVQISESTDSL